MLQHLHIRNYAIIEDLTIDLGKGLHIITGETGAGKSILLGALGLVLGDRADTSVLFEQGQKCVVEAIFHPESDDMLRQLFAEHELDESPELVIRREINPAGKSRSFVNDTPVTLQVLRSFASAMVDLHRQFDTLDLGENDFQRVVVDALAANQALRKTYRYDFQAYTQANRRLQDLLHKQQSSGKELDYIRFLFDELADANFVDNELEELEKEQDLLNHAEEIKMGLDMASHLLQEAEQPIVQQVRSIVQQLLALKSQPEGLPALIERLQAAQVELKDIAYEIEAINSHLGTDAGRLALITERLNLGNRLLKKHQVATTAELLAIKANLDGQLQQVVNIDEDIERLRLEVEQLHGQLTTNGKKLTESRKKVTGGFEDNVRKLLQQMGMPNASIIVAISHLAQPGPYGLDEITFLFDANKSGRMEPLEKVASGGELSRLMLAIKSLVARSMQMPTLIFDEIDTGISGEAAKQVGIIMQQLAAHHQLIAITHQPQIAARAHRHYFVYKQEQKGKVKTAIRQLKDQERVEAIARMLGGDQLTEASLRIATELVGS